MIQLREATLSSSGSTTPLRREDPAPNLAASDSLRRWLRAVRRGIDSPSGGSSPDAEPRRRLLRWEGTADWEPRWLLWVGVVAPDEKAESPALAGVDGGGLGPNDVSEAVAENGRGESGRRPRRLFSISSSDSER